MEYLIVGLGNIGETYADSRHNIGFKTIDYLAEQKQAKFITKPLAAITSIRHQGHKIWLVKPSTYMNESGKAVKHALKHLRLPIQHLLVVTDDLHLPFGQLRIKPQGGSGGHNGLKSISTQLHTTHYARLKFGIGNNFAPGKQANFVLSDFTFEENKTLDLYISQASQIVLDFCKLGIQQTAHKHNKKTQG